MHSLATGGMENGVVNVCNRLDPDRFAPSICVLRAGGALQQRVDPRRVGVFEVRRRCGNDPTVPLRLAYQLRRHRVDVLHTHSWVTLVEGYVAAAIARLPVVIHGEHGVMELRPRNVFVQRHLWPRFHQIVAVAESLADRMSQATGFPRQHIEVIPNGVDTDRFRPLQVDNRRLRHELGLPPDGFLVGSVARLVPVKNHPGTLRAFASLVESGVKATMAFAGEGPLLPELSSLVQQLKLNRHVYFLGELQRVDQFFNAIDVFVLNSHEEGMSNTILEAMSCGVPVVATSVGENSRLIGESGRLVPADDDRELAHVLAQLAHAPDTLKALGQKASSRARQEFNIGQMVDRYASLYLRLAPNRRRTLPGVSWARAER